VAQTIHVNEERLTHVARVISDAVQRGGYVSAVLTVANRTEVVWQQVVPGGDSVAWNSIFSIASISKPITITALMQLVERGHLALRDLVADYLPQWGQNGKERVTIWHLVTHTSGLDELRDKQFDELSLPPNVRPSARTSTTRMGLGCALNRAPNGRMRSSPTRSSARS
jgi:CubicO group peptidase (beta-lactamase class C family)